MNTFKTTHASSILADAPPATRPVFRRLLNSLLAATAVAMFLQGGTAVLAIEQPEYELLEQEGAVELRRYAPHIVAETLVDADFARAGNEGFRRLADYIFGNNRSRQKMAMTAPVAQAASEKIAMTAPVNMHREGETYRITFMMPSAYTLETLPEPVDDRVVLRQEPAQLVAALRYSGRWSHDRYEEHTRRLLSWIAQRGWEVAGEPILARYDPPFKPWFLRRNEVLISVRPAGPVTGGSAP